MLLSQFSYTCIFISTSCFNYSSTILESVSRQDDEPGDGSRGHFHGDGDGVVSVQGVHGGWGYSLLKHQGVGGDAGVVQGEGQVPGEGGACWVEDHGQASVVDTRVNMEDAVKVWWRDYEGDTIIGYNGTNGTVHACTCTCIDPHIMHTYMMKPPS